VGGRELDQPEKKGHLEGGKGELHAEWGTSNKIIKGENLVRANNKWIGEVGERPQQGSRDRAAPVEGSYVLQSATCH